MALDPHQHELQGRLGVCGEVGTVEPGRRELRAEEVGLREFRAGEVGEFEVVDLGINTDAETYIAALKEHRPDILGMSALLTTTMPYMKTVIETMVAEGLRDDFIVLVGGAPLNEEFGEAIGADAYCRDAATAVEIAKQLVLEKRAS